MTILFFISTPPASAQDISTGLVGHWKLDETSGTTAVDSTGSNNGTMTGGLDAANDSLAGKIGNALSFDGVNDYVDLGDISAVEGVTAFSVSVWVKNNKTFINNTGTERILAKVGGGLDTFDLAWQQNEDIYFGVQDNGGSWAYAGYVDGIPAGSGNQWHHVVGVYDGSNVYVYVNGVAGGVTPALTDATNNTAHVITIADPDGTSDGWDGLIDDVRIYNRVLTDADIAVLASGTAPGGLRYNDSSEAIEYHDGTEWVHAGLGSYAPNAVVFDGTTDRLTYNGSLTNVSDSKKATGSFWFRRDPLGNFEGIFQLEGGGLRKLRAVTTVGNEIRILGRNSADTEILNIVTSVINDSDWHHVMFSFDLADTAKRHLYVDGVSDLSATVYTDDVIDFSTIDDVQISKNSILYNGDLADFWLDTGTYIDLSIAANREKFISANGQPMYLGADGSLPLGKQPDIFLSGGTADWHTNKGTGGGFTENGALTDALDTPFAATWRSASTTNVQKFASDATADDYLGGNSAFGSVNSVSVSGMYAAVGAPGAGTAGAVYIFHTETGAELHKIDAPGGSDTNFGYGVEIEGNKLVVGAAGNCGADLYVYDINKSTTTPQVSITAGLNNCNGWDVDISGDKFIAGTRNGNFATVYDINDGTLLHTLNRTTAGASFNAYGVAIDGDWAIVGNSAFNSNEGRAYIYDLSACGASCTETHLLTASDAATGDMFGHGVEIDGDYAAVGAPGNARVYTFDVKTGTELQIIAPTASSGDAFADFGANITIDNKVMAVSQGRGGTSRTGRFEVFDVVSGTSLYSIQNPSGVGEDRFGWMLDMDDDVIVAGHSYDDDAANNAGAAWIFTNKPCATPDGRTGDIFYNTDQKVMQYCNGTDWVAMGPVGGTGGGGCASPAGAAGDIIFNARFNSLTYCNAEDWVAIGRKEYLANAVNFDGTNDYLLHNNPLTAADGKTGTVSVWFKHNIGTGVDKIIFGQNLSRGLSVRIGTADEVAIIGKTDGNTTILNMQSSIYVDDQWHHLLASWDLTDPAKRHIYIDDASDLASVTTYIDDFIDYTRGAAVGAFPSASEKYDGDLADLWIDFGTYIDLSIEANRRKFIDALGKPVYLGADGSGPTGTQPELFFSGDTANWSTNKGTSGIFTENGALTDAPTTPN